MFKRILTLACAAACCVTLLAGCNLHTSKAWTWTIETGDKVRIELDTSDDWNITSDSPFVVTDGSGDTVFSGTFVYADYYQEYVDAAKAEESATVIEEGEKDGNPYLFWNYADDEWDVCLLVDGSNTAILMGSAVSEDMAREALDRMTIELVND